MNCTIRIFWYAYQVGAHLQDPRQKLETIFKRHLLYIEGHAGIPRTIFSEETIVANENLRTRVQSTISMYFLGIKAIIEQGQSGGVLDEKMDPQGHAAHHDELTKKACN